MLYELPRHLYIHFPLCARRCPYCAFNVTTRNDAAWRRPFAATVLDSLPALFGSDGSPLPVFDTVYLGGGTPSLMEPGEVARILSGVQLAPDAEVTLELNPSNVNVQRMRDFAAAGVNRLSVGVQALDDTALVRLGRDHSARDALATLDAAHGLFERVSADVMIALPLGWRAAAPGVSHELRTLAQRVTHLSVYELTLEHSTAMRRAWDAGTLPMPDADAKAHAYEEVVCTLVDELQWRRYEVSSFAASEAAESRHNWAYWRQRPFLGVGPGAHSRLRGRGGVDAPLYERVEIPGPTDWANAPAHARAALLRPLSPAVERKELVLSALRTRVGLTAAQRQHVDPIIDGDQEAALIDGGFLARHGEGLVATAKGINVLDSLLERLLKD